MKSRLHLFIILLLIVAVLSACGKDGKSAYEIAVDYGFVGTEEEWLASLHGADGADGQNGADGTSGISGANGIDGTDGKSAYEIAVEYGFQGTQEEFVQLILGNGADTVEGEQVVDSSTGSYVAVPGKSAYEIAVDHGYIGTEEERLQSLQGAQLEVSEDGYLVLNGQKTSISTQKDIADLYEALDYLFSLEEVFVSEYQSCSGSSWSYTTSTFSGWGGSIGAPDKIDTLRFRVRARDAAITQIKVFLTENDKSGQVLYSQVLAVDIQPYQDAYVYWELPEVFENTEGKSLYFTYNCNQFCDMWYASKNISDTHYPAISTYTTNGKLLSSPASMTNVASDPTRYLPVEVGYVRKAFQTREEFSDSIHVYLPKQYELVAGDTFQLFYRGVVQAVNPYNYHIRVTCANGSAYPRYYEWTPTAEDVGSYPLTIQIYDDNHNLLGSGKTTLIVKEALAPDRNIHVLCVGDSLTGGGYWPAEMYRRLAQTGGTPEGNGFANITFVGQKQKDQGGTSIGFEGNGGWTWGTYLSETSPFYDPDTGKISFSYYCRQNNIETLDCVYFLLTWNGQGTPFKSDYNLNTGHFADAKKLIDTLHEEYPNAIVRCMGIQMPSQNGGMGANYGANGGYSDAYGILVSAMRYNRMLEQLCLSDEYKGFVKYVDTAGQFDTDYNMPSKEKPANTRTDETEIIGTNGVHPAMAGYYQIADAAYRALIHDIHTHFIAAEASA